MTPEKKILYIQNYIPPKHIFARKGFMELLPYFATLYKNNKIAPIVKNIQSKLNQKTNLPKTSLFSLKKEIINSFDFIYGGFKGSHKFPEYNKLKLLLDIYLLSKDKKFLNMLNLTLTNMAKSGMYDQIEGGFFRYTVYDDFSIPHFEKMLYTNALMLNIYSLAYRYSPKPLYKKVIQETINEFYLKYFDKKNSLFYAANSADSPGEGDYFCFSKQEIFKALKNIPNKKEILKYIHFDNYGNFEKNKNHIFFELNSSAPKNLDIFLKNLKTIRKTHPFPFIDKKKILSWNAMMATALFRASIVDKAYLKKAIDLLNSIYKNFYQNGTWYHSFVNKKEKKATLEDFAYLIWANIEAYEYTFDTSYLKKAKNLIKISITFKNKRWMMSQDFPATADEKSYPSALSVLFNKFIDFSVLDNNLSLYFFTKKELNYHLSLQYAYLTQAILKTKYNEFAIKNIHPKPNYPIFYPFYLWKKTDYNYYQICNIFACLKRSNHFREIKTFFEKLRY